MKISILIIFFFLGSKAFPYANMIRYGYTTCTACHNAPEGGGILTPYGKGIAQSTSAAGGELKENAFIKAISFQGKVEHAFQFRYSVLKKSFENLKSFPMQGDYLNVIHLSPKLRIETTLGRIGEVNDSDKSFSDQFILRKFLIAYRAQNGLEYSVGRNTLNFGLREVDHTLFIREKNKLKVDDTPTLLSVYRSNKKSASALQIILPGFYEEKNNQEYGIYGRHEKFFNKKFTLGAHILGGRTETVTRFIGGLFSRYSPSKYITLHNEFDFTQRSKNISNIDFYQYASLSKISFFPKDFIEISALYEWSQIPYLIFEEQENRYGVSTSFRINKNVSLMFDYRNYRSDDSKNWKYLAQIYFNGW
jgi:hypothetical protein